MASLKKRKTPEVMQLAEEIRLRISVNGILERGKLSREVGAEILQDLSLVGINISEVSNGIVERFLNQRKPDFRQPGLTWYQEDCLIPCGEGPNGEHFWVELGMATKAHLEEYLKICEREYQASVFIQQKRTDDFSFMDEWNPRKHKHFKDFRRDHLDLFEPAAEEEEET
jgi:hypothetical protein